MKNFLLSLLDRLLTVCSVVQALWLILVCAAAVWSADHPTSLWVFTPQMVLFMLGMLALLGLWVIELLTYKPSAVAVFRPNGKWVVVEVNNSFYGQDIATAMETHNLHEVEGIVIVYDKTVPAGDIITLNTLVRNKVEVGNLRKVEIVWNDYDHDEKPVEITVTSAQRRTAVESLMAQGCSRATANNTVDAAANNGVQLPAWAGVPKKM